MRPGIAQERITAILSDLDAYKLGTEETSKKAALRDKMKRCILDHCPVLELPSHVEVDDIKEQASAVFNQFRMKVFKTPIEKVFDKGTLLQIQRFEDLKREVDSLEKELPRYKENSNSNNLIISVIKFLQEYMFSLADLLRNKIAKDTIPLTVNSEERIFNAQYFSRRADELESMICNRHPQVGGPINVDGPSSN